MIFNDRYSKKNLARDYLFQGDAGRAEMYKMFESGELAKAKYLTVMGVKNADLSFIGSLVKLRSLTILSPSLQDIDISKLSKLQRLELGSATQKRIHGIQSLHNIELLALRSPNPIDLARLGGGGTFLSVQGCPTVWPKVIDPSRVRKIKIFPMRKGPFDVANMSNLSNLEDLSINSISKGIVNASKLSGLRNLRILHFWDVASLDSKDWILNLPNLELVAIWGKHDFTSQEISELIRIGVFDDEDPETLVSGSLKGYIK